jgi:hypothetical protein
LATGFDVGFGALSDSSSEDSSSLDSSLGPGFDFAAAFAFVAAGLGWAGFVRAGALAADLAGTGLAGASSEDSSSESSSLDSSLELDSAAAVAFGGGAFGSVALDAALPSAALALALPALVGAAFDETVFVCEALGANFGDSSSESLSLDPEDESLLAEGFVDLTFLLVALTAGSALDSLSLDSEGESAFGGGTLDFYSRVKQRQFIDPKSCALFHWSQEV